MRNLDVLFCTTVLVLAIQSCNPPSIEAVSGESISPIPQVLPQPESSLPSEPATVTPLPAAIITEEKMPFEITSIAFTHQGIIPPLYSCKGSDISPPLTWGEPPEGTRSFTLIMDDPDGGNWIHWVIYNLPAEIRGLPENKPQNARLPDGSLQGTNSWGRLGYGGPCPPSGTHRYFFRLHALDSMLDLPSGARAPAIVQAMAGHILAQVELMGFFSH
jgi:hypothetical protein